MKKFKYLLLSFMALFLAMGTTSCSDDDDPGTPDDPTLI